MRQLSQRGRPPPSQPSPSTSVAKALSPPGERVGVRGRCCNLLIAQTIARLQLPARRGQLPALHPFAASSQNVKQQRSEPRPSSNAIPGDPQQSASAPREDVSPVLDPSPRDDAGNHPVLPPPEQNLQGDLIWYDPAVQTSTTARASRPHIRADPHVTLRYSPR
jgi:hypothetical protein